MRLLSFLLRHQAPDFCNDNLHRIAISNLKDGDRSVERWWANKYRTPTRAFDEYTIEELIIEKFEDFYEKHPEEIQRFEAAAVAKGLEWDGTMPAEHEAQMKRYLSKKRKVDLSKYQSDAPLTEEEEKKILSSLGMNLPGSKRVVNMGVGEFDEEFLGGDS